MASNLTRIRIATLGIAVLVLGTASAQEEAVPGEGTSLSVIHAAIAREVEDRAPVNEGTSFPPDVGHLYCFTKVEGSTGESVIYHVWSHDGVERARVELPLKGSPWRTWSQKTILPSWTGDWTVTVEDEEGTVLTRLDFVIEAPRETGEEGETEESNPGAESR